MKGNTMWSCRSPIAVRVIQWSLYPAVTIGYQIHELWPELKETIIYHIFNDDIVCMGNAKWVENMAYIIQSSSSTCVGNSIIIVLIDMVIPIG